LIAVEKLDPPVKGNPDALAKTYSLALSRLSYPSPFMQNAGFQEHLERMIEKDKDGACAAHVRGTIEMIYAKDKGVYCFA
jgi:hypothetical protein